MKLVFILGVFISCVSIAAYTFVYVNGMFEEMKTLLMEGITIYEPYK